MQVIAWKLRFRGQTIHWTRFVNVLPGGEEVCVGNAPQFLLAFTSMKEELCAKGRGGILIGELSSHALIVEHL